jgi:hypothetical protein
MRGWIAYPEYWESQPIDRADPVAPARVTA